VQFFCTAGSDEANSLKYRSRASQIVAVDLFLIHVLDSDFAVHRLAGPLWRDDFTSSLSRCYFSWSKCPCANQKVVRCAFLFYGPGFSCSVIGRSMPTGESLNRFIMSV